MPEGDTIHVAAGRLARALERRHLRGFRTSVPQVDRVAVGVAGRRVAAVRAHGKCLSIRLDDGRLLLTHMRMSGCWEIYRHGVPWRRPERQARVVLETESHVAVCFNAPLVALLTPFEARNHPLLRDLGPDILAPDLDPQEIRARLRRDPRLPVGEALMRQQAVAGIGNVYKSETLFVCGIDPFVPVHSLDDGTLDRIIGTARDLMRRNLHGFKRRTRTTQAGPGAWVYRRRGQPCMRCGTPIAMRRQGDAARSTYFCPSCQQDPPAEPGVQ